MHFGKLIRRRFGHHAKHWYVWCVFCEERIDVLKEKRARIKDGRLIGERSFLQFWCARCGLFNHAVLELPQLLYLIGQGLSLETWKSCITIQEVDEYISTLDFDEELRDALEEELDWG